MKTNTRTTSATPVLLAALAGAGAGILAGVLLAPIAGPALRQNMQSMAHKYTLLAREEQQQFRHHLVQRAARLGVAYKDVARTYQGFLLRLGLVTPPARLPY